MKYISNLILLFIIPLAMIIVLDYIEQWKLLSFIAGELYILILYKIKENN